MKTLLNILTLGIYSLLSKTKDVSSKVEKRVYRKDGSLKKEINRDTEYSEGEGLSELPK